MPQNDGKPVLGILLGDATGIGPELVAKLAAEKFYDDYCRPIFLGDVRVFQAGLDTFGGTAKLHTIASIKEASWEEGYPILDLADQDPAQIVMGKASDYCGAACNRMIRLACDLCLRGDIQGFVFAPFNKEALKKGGCEFESEHHLFAHIFGVTGPFGEINIVDNVMTVRTTSHIPIGKVARELTVEKIYRAIELAQITGRSAGIAVPKLGVAALNPHCGENGLCGKEEIEIIRPAIQKGIDAGWSVSGPYSSDILFIRAFNGDFDVVVTMYHDQGQIALKLNGFERGICVAGGQPYPIGTCGHGTAYGKAGKGIANTLAFKNAVKMVSRMAATGFR